MRSIRRASRPGRAELMCVRKRFCDAAALGPTVSVSASSARSKACGAPHRFAAGGNVGNYSSEQRYLPVAVVFLCRNMQPGGLRPVVPSTAQAHLRGDTPENLSDGDRQRYAVKGRNNMRHFILAAALMPLAHVAFAQTTGNMAAPPAPARSAAGPAMSGPGTGWAVRPPDPNNCGTPDEPRPCPPMPRHPLPYFPANRYRVTG